TCTSAHAVPRPGTASAILTVNPDDAVAAEPGADVQLDGNTDPAGTNGEVPNEDAYTWKLSCGSSLDIMLTGIVDGRELAGKVGGAGARVTCTPGPSSDQVTTVHWSGTLPNGTQVSGSFDLKPGSWTLGPGGSAQ